ncbi:hypothetical protein EOM39_04995 [Candidatus Gracilibacteria bacterium]|nr:hypothetical protein [Candidatus Gracilibacteria bacterium]
MKETFKLIKSISIDILLLYKKFLHWNISKFIIFIASTALSFIMALPFIILILSMYYGLNLGEYLNGFNSGFLEFLALMGNRPFVFVILMLLSIMLIFAALFGYSYRRILFIKLNLSYLDGNNLGYLKNSYFDIKLIWQYLQVIALVALFLAIPVLVFFIVFFILFFIFGGASGVEVMIRSSQFNIFTILILLLLIVCFSSFIYLSYRLYFAVIMFVDEKNYDTFKGPKFYIKESYLKTKNMSGFMKFVTVFILLSIVVLPLGNVQDYFSKSLKEVRAYIEFSQLGEVEKSEVEKNQNYQFIDSLKEKYSGYSDENLKSIEITYFYFNYLFVIINFLIIFGVLEMTYISFYKHEIMKKKGILSMFS